MCCSICALSLFPTKSHFTLCPTFPQKALQQASESSAGHPRSNVHPRGRKCMKRNNNESKETGFSTCLSRRAQKKKKKKLGSSLKCQTYYTVVYEAGLWVEKVLDDLHLAQQTTPLCVWWIKAQKNDSWKKPCWRTETWLWLLRWTVPLQQKAEEFFSPTFLENMFFSLSLLSWMRKWTPLSCLCTQHNAMASFSQFQVIKHKQKHILMISSWIWHTGPSKIPNTLRFMRAVGIFGHLSFSMSRHWGINVTNETQI